MSLEFALANAKGHILDLHGPLPRGAWLASDVQDPVTLDVILPVGYWVWYGDMCQLRDTYGIDLIDIEKE